MSAVACDAKHELIADQGRGVFEPQVPLENATEQTAQISIIPVAKTEDMVTGTGLGWFWPLWHRFDEEAKTRELEDPKGLHGNAGGRWVFAECGLTASPDESIVAASSSLDCPVCFPDDSGHLFTWDRRGSHIVARCLLTGCGKTDAQTRDPNTGRRRPCRSSTPEVSS
ncbi:hypothetical protein ACIA8G_35040 [Lentzea sp. NPDC051213]|uniref:hypothetical protein n=1 Tax=Lentzea sp. NPDC051213 TaxID=3364126 RepID=UPI0037B39748